MRKDSNASTGGRRARRVLPLLAGLALAALAGCDTARGEPPAPPAAPHAAAHDTHVHHAARPAAGDLALQAGELSDYSIYHLDAEWWDQHGGRRTLATLAGRVQVVSMVYTHCAHTCPRILTEMKRLEAELAGTPGVGAGFVLVSLDPERDTPDRLASFARATHLDPARWTLLGGAEDDVLELATLLGIKYRRESATDFSHSNALLVLDAAGEIVFRQLGLGQDPAPLLAAIRAAQPAR